MTDYGVVPEGFRAKTQREILDEIETDQKADISPTLDVSAQSPDGQRNAVVSRELALLWELLQVCNDGLDRDKAEDDQLIALCKLTGTTPHGATISEVSCTCNLDIGTVLTPGVHFAAVLNKPDVLFTPKASAYPSGFTAPSTGNHAVTFVAVDAGPVLANAGTLTVIMTTITGWNSITNPLDAKPGQPADTNETLRERQAQEVAAAGSGTPAAIKADILQLEDTTGTRVVQSAQVLNNTSDLPDPVTGVPGKSFEVIVDDSPTLPNDQIAQAIFDVAGAGIYSHGTLSGTAVDEEGVSYPIKFSRPTDRNVWVTFETVVTTSAYPGDAEFKSQVVTYLRDRIGVGDPVPELTCWLAGGNVAGVKSIGAVKLGFAVSPTGTDDLAASPRERPRFDTTRIVKT
jgi:hypothetical protein